MAFKWCYFKSSSQHKPYRQLTRSLRYSTGEMFLLHLYFMCLLVWLVWPIDWARQVVSSSSFSLYWLLWCTRSIAGSYVTICIHKQKIQKWKVAVLWVMTSVQGCWKTVFLFLISWSFFAYLSHKNNLSKYTNVKMIISFIKGKNYYRTQPRWKLCCCCRKTKEGNSGKFW